MRRSLRGVVVVAAGFVCGALLASESELGPDSEVFHRRWLRDLKSDDFRVREEACARIAEAGAGAIPTLKDAAGEMDRETAARCLGVIERLVRSTDLKTSQAAKDALGALEGSSNAAVADLARSVQVKLEKLPPLPSRYPIGGPNPFIFRPQVPVGNGGLRVSSRSVNGDRTTTIEEPGKTTTITDSQGKDIRITITETVNGAEKRVEHEGKDLEDLRRKSPTAADLYERYAARGAAGVDVQKRMDEMRARSDKLRALSQESFDLTRERLKLKREGKEGTPEYADLEKRLQENRESQLQTLRR